MRIIIAPVVILVFCFSSIAMADPIQDQYDEAGMMPLDSNDIIQMIKNDYSLEKGKL